MYTQLYLYIYIYTYINIHILWIGLHSHWQRAPQPAKLSSSFSNQRTASKQDCPKWQGFMDMQGSATTRVVWSPRLSARTASSRSSKWLNARYPSLYLNPMGSPEPACAVRGELVKTWRLEGTACLPTIFGGCNDDGFTIYIYICWYIDTIWHHNI